MKQIAFTYTIEIEGNEIDAKMAQNLNPHTSLKLERLSDLLDTFEIVVQTLEDKPLEMLSYPDSVGIAPFLDKGLLTVLATTLQNTQVILGKTHAKDCTALTFEVEFAYDDTALTPFISATGAQGFMPKQDDFYCLCLYRILDYSLPIITQTHCNRYEFEVDLDQDTRRFFDIDLDDENYFYQAEVLFNPEFTECKMRAKIYSEDKNYLLDLSPEDSETFLLLVNHCRIFADQDPIEECEIILP